jgi:signal transduction histidine kinase
VNVATLLDDLTVRARRAPAWLGDVALAAAVGVPTAMDAWWNEPGTTQADTITYTLAAVSIVALVVRRRAPLAVSVVCGLALTGLYMRGHHGELLNLPLMVALYTVAVQGDRRRSVLVGVVAVTWSGVLGFTSDDPLGARGGSPVLEMLVPVVPLLLGEAVRSRRELATHAATEQEREATRRVDAERTRIARELHDVLAHTLAAVNVQTAAAAAAIDTRPDIARESLAQARASTKAALAELRATLHLLRDSDDNAPWPTLDQLDDIAAVARAAGLQVTLHVDVPAGLPDGTALATYRIVQEAITNTIRHSRARRVAISVSATDGTLRVEVVDDGQATPHACAQPAGLGLLGMRERAHALGGSFDHGHVNGGGYRVTATLPTSGEAP